MHIFGNSTSVFIFNRSWHKILCIQFLFILMQTTNFFSFHQTRASSRCCWTSCRWALIKDESLYERVSRYVSLNTMGVSHDTQLRALKLLKVVLQGEGGEIFGYGYQVMRDRWMKLSKVLSTSKRISLQKLAPQYCIYFRKIRGPSPGKFFLIEWICWNSENLCLGKSKLYIQLLSPKFSNAFVQATFENPAFFIIWRAKSHFSPIKADGICNFLGGYLWGRLAKGFLEFPARRVPIKKKSYHKSISLKIFLTRIVDVGNF